MNKRIPNELAIGVILVAAVIVGGFFLLQGRYESIRVEDEKTAASNTSAITRNTNEITNIKNENNPNLENVENVNAINIWSSCSGQAINNSLTILTSDKLEELRSKLNASSNIDFLTQADIVIKENGHIFYQDKDLSNTAEQVYLKGNILLDSKYLTKLPERLFVDGNLVIRGTNDNFAMPESVIVKGSFLLNGDISRTPEKIIVGDYFGISGTKISKLPENFMVGKNLNASDTLIKELPNNFFVGGNVNLARTKIINLPLNFSVFGDLNLTSTPISSLPCGLNVGNTLIIAGTPIVNLPSNLKIGHLLDAEDTPLGKILWDNPNIFLEATEILKAEVYHNK